MGFVVAVCDGCKTQRHSDEMLVRGEVGNTLCSGRSSTLRDQEDTNPGDGWAIVRKLVTAKTVNEDLGHYKVGRQYQTTLHFCAGCAGRIG